MTVLGLAVRGMGRSIDRLAGYEGSYDRKGVGSLPVRATLTVRDYELVDDEGFVTRVQSQDWLVVTEDIAEFYPPLPGDRFTVDAFEPSLPDPVGIFELMPLGKRPCFAPHDSQGETIVLHTTRVTSAG